MIAATSSTQVPSVNWTPVDVRRTILGRTCTLPDRMRLGRSSFVTAELADISWFGSSPYRPWSKRAFALFRNWLQTTLGGSKWMRKLMKRVNSVTSRGRPLSHTRRTNHAPFLTLRYTWHIEPIINPVIHSFIHSLYWRTQRRHEQNIK